MSIDDKWSQVDTEGRGVRSQVNPKGARVCDNSVPYYWG